MKKKDSQRDTGKNEKSQGISKQLPKLMARNTSQNAV